MTTHLILTVSLVFWIAVGALGGFYAGKAETLSLLVNDKIECSLTIDPISKKAMKL